MRAPEGGGSNQLDPAVWQVVAQDPAGVVLVPTDSAYWAWWTLPAVGYTLQQNDALTTVPWQDVTQPAIQTGPLKGVLLPSSSLPPGNSAFFRVVKPE